LRDEKENPIQPYDVTAHTLPLLMDVEVRTIYRAFSWKPRRMGSGFGTACGASAGQRTDMDIPSYGIYRSNNPATDEGWTRWVLEKREKESCEAHFATLTDKQIRENRFARKAVVFPDQSPNQILNGYAKGSMPDEYTGGVGKEGVENLKKFVESGGTLVFLNRASNFAIEQFNLPVRDVTRGLNRKDFYIPGSILRTELDTTHPIAKGMPQRSIAWFENGPVFELVQSAGLSPSERDKSRTLNAKIIARYPSDPKQILLSGWALGAEKIAGKAALVEFTIGKGKIILFGFRPQYRGQSLATFPLLFNAISSQKSER
ncbi:MAG: hypothetical protein ABJB34_05525, partial [Acidobacteriota bacterium]